MFSESVLIKRALSVFVIAGVFSGLISTPAQAVSDRNVNCSVSGYIKIRSNEVVKKDNGESGPGKSCVGTAVIPEGVTRLGDYAMDGESSLTSIVIPDTVTAFGANVFTGTGLSRIIIPASVTSISSGVFAYNPNLTSLIIPASVTTIGYYIGAGSPNLKKIYFLGRTAPNTHVDAFKGMGNDTTYQGTGSGATLYVPDGSSGYANDGELWRGVTVSGSGAVVVYESNGADSGTAPNDANSYAVGDLVTVLANTNLTRAGFAFDGWTLEKDGSSSVLQPGETFVATSGATLVYANWVGDPKVRYNGNGNTGGSAPVDPSSPYAQNSSATVLGNSGFLEKTGYTFDGWNTKADGTGTSYAATGTLPIATSNITLFAKWKPETHTVTYDGNGNTGGNVPVDVASPHNYNTSVTVQGNSGNLTRTGYDFAGWNTQADGLGTNRAATSLFTITSSDVVLYAKWTPKLIGITYSGNGNTSGRGMGPFSFNYGSSVTVSGNENNLQKTGYDFDGWNTKADGTGTDRAVASSFTIGADYVELFAKWIVKSFIVTYDGNGNIRGGVPVNPATHAFSSTVTLWGNVEGLAKTGYVFSGWNTQADGSGTQFEYPASFTMPANNVTLYAQWSNSGTVTYSGNGNTGGTIPADADYNFGSTVTVSTNSGALKKSGYTFAGWNTAEDGSGTTYVSPGSVTFEMPESDVTLFATWELLPVVDKPVVTKPSAKAAITLPRFPTSISKLPNAGTVALKNILKKSGSSATYTVTGVAGKLPGVPISYVKALAKVRAERLQANLIKLGVKKSNIKIKIEITELRVIPISKISVG
jgi:uncharacterized repeat protein (TIGR02543 family)